MEQKFKFIHFEGFNGMITIRNIELLIKLSQRLMLILCILYITIFINVMKKRKS